MWRVAGVDVTVPPDLGRRVWERDPSAWAPGEDDPAARLGWLELPFTMERQIERLTNAARDLDAAAIDTVVLLGMGGSSLAPEVFARTFGADRGRRLIVLDSTHPAQVAAVTAGLDLAKTLFLVSSKSGGTIETMSLYRFFRARIDDGAHFMAITDPGTSLAQLARDEGFRDTWLNPPDIGGRYSALSFFGLAPAALIGIDIHALLEGAREAAAVCAAQVPTQDNPGLDIGCAIGQLARAGRDKLTFLISDEIASFGVWVEQLIAESTGKQGTGITPVVDEPLVEPATYADDRVFVMLAIDGDDTFEPRIAELESRGHPTITFTVPGPHALGELMFVWEFAVAVAGSVLGINAFDQPNVESAKRATRSMLDSGEGVEWGDDDPDKFFADASSGELAVFAAFAPRTQEAATVLQSGREKLAARGIATMSGFGPRYLHSTGQLQKGGSPDVRALVILDDPQTDERIPGSDFGFADLIRAQAAGDANALEDAGRPVARSTWKRFAEWATS
ncbi:MAG: glucose-6-phosphate isomerase [Actinomycetota bacterium]|nr:glucose-6-phosphate isomerase [Actinomycetota bacterium]